MPRVITVKVNMTTMNLKQVNLMRPSEQGAIKPCAFHSGLRNWGGGWLKIK